MKTFWEITSWLGLLLTLFTGFTIFIALSIVSYGLWVYEYVEECLKEVDDNEELR